MTNKQTAERIIAALEAFEEGTLIADLPEQTGKDVTWLDRRFEEIHCKVRDFEQARERAKVDFIVWLMEGANDGK